MINDFSMKTSYVCWSSFSFMVILFLCSCTFSVLSCSFALRDHSFLCSGPVLVLFKVIFKVISSTSENFTIKHDSDKFTVSNDRCLHDQRHNSEDRDCKEDIDDITDDTTETTEENYNINPTTKPVVTN